MEAPASAISDAGGINLWSLVKTKRQTAPREWRLKQAFRRNVEKLDRDQTVHYNFPGLANAIVLFHDTLAHSDKHAISNVPVHGPRKLEVSFFCLPRFY